jgi:hypothetical protein
VGSPSYCLLRADVDRAIAAHDRRELQDLELAARMTLPDLTAEERAVLQADVDTAIRDLHAADAVADLPRGELEAMAADGDRGATVELARRGVEILPPVRAPYAEL